MSILLCRIGLRKEEINKPSSVFRFRNTTFHDLLVGECMWVVNNMKIVLFTCIYVIYRLVCQIPFKIYHEYN